MWVTASQVVEALKPSPNFVLLTGFTHSLFHSYPQLIHNLGVIPLKSDKYLFLRLLFNPVR